MIGKAIYTALTGNSALNAILVNKVFPVIIPQADQLPALCYYIGAKEPSPTNDGPSKLDKITLNIHIASMTYFELEDIAEKVRVIIEAMTDSNIQSIRFNSENDDYNPEGKAYIRNQTYTARQKRILYVAADSISITADSIVITADNG